MKKLLITFAILVPTMSFAGDMADKVIYDALNVQADGHGVPPVIVSWKKTGRLECTATLNTETQEENYRCDLPNPSAGDNDQVIYDALNVEEQLHEEDPTYYEKTAGRLSCLRLPYAEGAIYLCGMGQ
jgi:hypothetical protein